MKPAIILLWATMTMSCGSLPAHADDKDSALKAQARTQVLVDSVSRAWLATEWQSYASRFVTSDGRVVDNGNGNVSHSEGQGYGLLLAATVGDAARFEAIWQWTAKTLMVRPDGLAAWKWDPAAKSVTDTNNATDGDILIAWALSRAAKRFDRPDYRTAAAKIAQAIGALAVVPSKTGPVLLPGVTGFGPGEQPDGPIVNLSYWVFPAFPALKDLAPGVDWAGVRRSGLILLEQSHFGGRGLPSDWESLAGPHPRPAANFQSGFGYNAVRIPLYLALDGSKDARSALKRFAGAWNRVASIDPRPDSGISPITLPIAEAGYDLVLATAGCGVAGRAIPAEMINTRSSLYYPETLRLLSVMAIQERFPACL